MEQNLVAKQKMVSYVHDATEIEKDIYLLEETKTELEYKVRENKREIEKVQGYIKQISEWKPTYSYPPNYVLYQKKMLVPGTKEYREMKKLIWQDTEKEAPGCLSAVAAIIVFLGSTGALIDGSENFPAQIGLSLIFTIATAVTIFQTFKHIKIKKDIKETNRDRAIFNKNLQEQIEEIEQENNKNKRLHEQDTKQKNDELRQKENNLHNLSIYYQTQSEEIQKKLQPLYEQREKFYSIDIVPPDYRTMDCVYVLDQIFRNDLADDMRSAIMLYEERVFRGEVVRGIKAMERYLGNISTLMHRLKHDVEDIRSTVQIMSQDVYAIYQRQEEQLSKTEKLSQDIKENQKSMQQRSQELFEETQMSRFAAEALRNSNEKIIKYIEEKEQKKL